MFFGICISEAALGGANAGFAGVAAEGCPVGGVAAVEIEILHTRGLCSYYAEPGSVMVGFDV